MPKKDYLTTLVVYFKDGNTGRFPSNDPPAALKRGNIRPGLARLRKLLAKWPDKYDTAIIYHREHNYPVEKYVNGQSVTL